MKGFEPNLFDKLLDDDSANAAASPLVRRMSLDELKETVARDVECLLNTRLGIAEESINRFEQCRRSVASYGLGDFVGRSLSSFNDCVFICRSIENAIARHEPRLAQVKVGLTSETQSIRVLCFSISAVLIVKPAQEPVSFDAVLHPSSLKYSVARSRRTVAA
jgi:type VI secretion system protein ImpF